MYQLFCNDKPCGYDPVSSIEEVRADMKIQHASSSRQSGTESISDITDDSFTVECASGKPYTYTIEQL